MKTVFAQIKDFLNAEKIKPDSVLIAFSGGMDSVALFLVLRELWGNQNIFLAYFNHHLQSPQQSRQERNLVKLLSQQWNVPLYEGNACEDLRQKGRKKRIGLEAAAREARYAFLLQTQQAIDATYLATAHHRDDQEETLLMNLFSASNFEGLRGIPFRQGQLIRPLLNTAREELFALVMESKLPFHQDLSNASLDYQRNRVRHQLIPMLKDLLPHYRHGLFRLQDLAIQAHESALASLVAWESWGSDSFRIHLQDLESLWPYQRRMLFFRLYQILGFSGRLSSKFWLPLMKTLPEASGTLLRDRGLCIEKRGRFLYGYKDSSDLDFLHEQEIHPGIWAKRGEFFILCQGSFSVGHLFSYAERRRIRLKEKTLKKSFWERFSDFRRQDLLFFTLSFELVYVLNLATLELLWHNNGIALDVVTLFVGRDLRG